MRIKSLFLLLAGTASSALAAPRYDVTAPIAYLKDLQSGAVLLARDADRPIPPASMAKMMTAYVLFDALKRGELKLNQRVMVNDETWRRWNNQGSSMFLSPGQAVRVEDLLHGVITLSGNDACVVLAEGLSGSEAAFVERMNRTARRIGLTASRFGNANGWPDEGRTRVTARDLARLAERTIHDHPDLYRRFYSRSEFRWGDIVQPNRDPLLGRVPGADGLKTGHTEEAGYGFTGSAVQRGRRLVMVVAGLDSFNGRIAESVGLMNWGFRAWNTRPLFRQGAAVATAPVQLGSATQVSLVAPRDLGVTVPAGSGAAVRISVRYTGPIRAPIAKGQPIAELIARAPGQPEQRMPLVAGEQVSEAGFFGRVWNGLKRLLGLA